MPDKLSITHAPEDVVQRQRERAERHHRSLQGELIAVIEAAAREERLCPPATVLAKVRRLGLSTPNEPTAIVRADCDVR